MLARRFKEGIPKKPSKGRVELLLKRLSRNIQNKSTNFLHMNSDSEQ
jgi:hypothetical protein